MAFPLANTEKNTNETNDSYFYNCCLQQQLWMCAAEDDHQTINSATILFVEPQLPTAAAMFSSPDRNMNKCMSFAGGADGEWWYYQWHGGATEFGLLIIP